MEETERSLVPLEETPFEELECRDQRLLVSYSETEADVPVPERPTPKQLAKSRLVVSQMKVSQKIGVLLYLNEKGELSVNGARRLSQLQETQSFEALSSGIDFARRLAKDEKLASSFWVARFHLQRPFHRKTPRRAEQRRIGVGYRDKGTLRPVTEQGRREAISDSFLHVGNFDQRTRDFLLAHLSYLIVDGEWLDLSEVPDLDPGFLGEIRAHLCPP